MTEKTPKDVLKDPLHGITLKALLETLVARHGWPGLAEHVTISCFTRNPTIKSSLKFLRKTPWARAKVEALYVSAIRAEEKRKKRNAYRKLRRQRAESQGSPTTPAPEGLTGETTTAEALMAETTAPEPLVAETTEADALMAEATQADGFAADLTEAEGLVAEPAAEAAIANPAAEAPNADAPIAKTPVDDPPVAQNLTGEALVAESLRRGRNLWS